MEAPISTSVTFNGTTYSVPAAGELNWSSLSAFLIDVGNNAAVSEEMKQAIRVATTSPVTVSASTDCTVVTDLSVAGAVTVNLPAGANKQLFIIVDGKGDALTNNITINRNGSDTIAGSTSLVLNHNRQAVFLQYHAATTDWKILANVTAPADLDNKQPLDATLTALAGYNSNGILTQTAADTFTGRTITAANNKVAITNGDGVSGNPTVGINEGNILLNNLGGIPLNISSGGTGQITQTAAFDALAPTTTTGDIIYHNGTDNVRLPIGTDGQALKVSSGIPAWGDGGGGTGELNIFTNPQAASSIVGWDVVGTAGSGTTTTASNYTLSRVSGANSPLNPVVATAFAASTTAASSEANNSGVGVGSITMPTSLKSKKLKVELYVTTPVDTDGVWRLSVWDGSTRLSLSTDSSSVTTLPSNFTGKFVTYVDTTANTTYHVRLTQTTRTNANTLYYTNAIFGTGIQPQGAVVGEWQSYTPTITGQGTVTLTYAEWRRVGSNMEIRARWTAGTVDGNNLTVKLPTGYNHNNSTNDALCTGSMVTSYGGASQGGIFPILSSSDTTVLYWTHNNSRSGTTGLAGNAVTVNNSVVHCTATFPVSQFAGSGTVNLAQNEVEYASTSGAWTADSSATQYGTSGQIMSGALTVAVTKTVTWQTPVQPTDKIEVQLSLDGTTWFNAESRAPIHLAAAGTIDSSAGVRINGSSGTTTSIQFARYQLMANDDSPVVDWVNTMYWRCIKYKSGSPCGFGMATATQSGLVKGGTVPGQVTGSATAAGYIGQIITSTSSATGSIGTGANVTTTICSLVLPAGVWMINASVEFIAGNSFNFNKFSISSAASFDAAYATSPQAAIAGSHSSPVTISRLVLTSGATFYSTAYTWIPSGTSSYQNASMTAVRIG